MVAGDEGFFVVIFTGRIGGGGVIERVHGSWSCSRGCSYNILFF